MVKPHELPAPPGAHRRTKRLGRGDGSGRGSYSGRGRKGQGARSGGRGRFPPGFEGNQLPLVHRLPTLRGFTNAFRVQYSVVNLKSLDRLGQPGQPLTPAWMAQAGLVRRPDTLVKVLGDGEVTKALQVSAHRFSQSAKGKLLAAGGSVEELPLPRGFVSGKKG